MGLKGNNTYEAWRSMKQKCQYPNHASYPNFGGCGIKICDRWQKFENFLEDMGSRPNGMFLGRINNNENYEPKNCQWVIESGNNEVKKHGHAIKNKTNGTYTSWIELNRRCKNKNRKTYKDYGGRGIKVCERWQVFENFLEDMGERPIGMQIDRINNDGNYEPGNCRWISPEENKINSRHTRWIEAFGEIKPISKWAKEFNISYSVLYKRLKRGLTPEKALCINSEIINSKQSNK